MQKLIKGIHQFQKQVFHPQRSFFESLAQGQHPQVLFITCADSRINPNLITQTNPGELFIVRNAGNIVPPYTTAPSGEVASIEYAVSVLRVSDIILCGHSHCGAMEAILHPERVKDLPAVSNWLGHAEATRRIVQDNYKHLDEEHRLNVSIQENVLLQLKHLETHPAVAAGLSSGQLSIHGWVYKIETGQVFGFQSETHQFILLSSQSIATAALEQPERLAFI